MKWFDGDVSQAIAESRRSNVAFLVYIEGDNEDSNKMKSVWERKEISDLCCKNCVGIKINFQSDQFQQFSHFYPVLCIPSTYIIGDNGVPLEVIGGALSAEEFTVKIQAAFQVYQKSVSGSSNTDKPKTENSTPQTDEIQSSTSMPGPSNQTENTLLQQSSTSMPGPSNQTENTLPQNKEEEPSPTLESSSDASENTASSSTNDLDDRVQRAKELVEKRRLEKEQEEEEKTKTLEMSRRKLGQDMAKSKQKREEQNMKEQAAKIREERQKEKAARQAVKEAIARDRAEKETLWQLEKATQNKEQTSPDRNPEPCAARDTTQNSSTQSSRARIQFRLPDGSCIVNTFDADDLLEAARQFVSQHLGGRNVVMCTTYPRQQLADEDCSRTLRDLGLTPTCTIIVALSSQVTKHRAGGGTGGGGVVGDILSYLFIPILTIWNAIKAFVFGTPYEPRGGTNRATAPEPRTPEQSSNLRRRKVEDTRTRREGNIHRLRGDDDDDENNTWNGNSTQQM